MYIKTNKAGRSLSVYYGTGHVLLKTNVFMFNSYLFWNYNKKNIKTRHLSCRFDCNKIQYYDKIVLNREYEYLPRARGPVITVEIGWQSVPLRYRGKRRGKGYGVPKAIKIIVQTDIITTTSPYIFYIG